MGQGLLVHRYTEEFARHGQVTRSGAAHRRRRHPAQPLPQRPAHLRASCSSSASSRSSTRTTPSRPPRSASATTTGWPRWSRTWSTPTCCVLLSDVDGLYDAPPSGAGEPADRRGARRRRPRRHPHRPGRAASGVGTGGMQTKLEAARIATGAGIPVVLTDTEPAPARAGGGARSARCSTRPAGAARRGCSGSRTPPSRKGRLLLDDGRGARGHRAARLAAAGRHHRRRRARSSPATRSTWSTPTGPGGGPRPGQLRRRASCPTLLGRSTRDLARELGAAYEREVVHRDDLVVL